MIAQHLREDLAYLQGMSDDNLVALGLWVAIIALWFYGQAHR